MNYKKYQCLIPIGSTIVIYFIIQIFSDLVFGVKNHYFGGPLKFWGLYWPDLNFNASLLPDLAVQIALAYGLWLMMRGAAAFLIVQVVFMGFLYFGNALHISLFGEPPSAHDVFAIGSLFGVLTLVEKLAILLPVLTLILIFFLNIKKSISAVVSGVMLFLVFPMLLVVNAAGINDSLEGFYPYKSWDKKFNYDSRGGSIYVFDEVVRYFLKSENIPDVDAVTLAVTRLNNGVETSPNSPPEAFRSLHLIVVESLWDAGQLSNADFNTDPFDPAFRKLWQSTNKSSVLSPVFGGGTANAEFEVLCGQPATVNGMVFQIGLSNERVSCLPRILSEQGYLTVASHPNKPAFWNRVNAYRRIGFDTYRTKNNFIMDDLNGPYLSNESLFRQNREYLGSLPVKHPLFNYVLTLSEHWPYHLNEEKRVAFIQSKSKEAMVEKYANAIRYSTAEVMAHLALLKEADPEALVVILGDHLPLLGKNFSGYRESGLLLEEKSQFSSENARQFVTTPLIIIDGRKGAQDVGAITMSEVPTLILNLLGLRVPKELSVFSQPSNNKVRSIRGLGLFVLSSKGAAVCRAATDVGLCAKAHAWARDIDTLSKDVRVGHNHLYGLGSHVNSLELPE